MAAQRYARGWVSDLLISSKACSAASMTQTMTYSIALRGRVKNQVNTSKFAPQKNVVGHADWRCSDSRRIPVRQGDNGEAREWTPVTASREMIVSERLEAE